MDIHLSINGEDYTVNTRDVPIDWTLNEFIRQRAQLTGTKFMCLEGGCGACVVTVACVNLRTNAPETFAVNSCLKSFYACDGYAVTTVEGLGSRARGYHPLQTAINRTNGTQCGYCTPGMVMNMYGLLRGHTSATTYAQPLTMADIEGGFGGNICRCTGYRPILDAFKSFASDAPAELVRRCRGGDCDVVADIEDLLLNVVAGPPRVQRKQTTTQQQQTCSSSSSGGATWLRVVQLPELLDALGRLDDTELYMLVAGNTARGITRPSEQLRTFIDITGVPELAAIAQTADKLTVGATVTLSDAIRAFRVAARSQSGFEYCAQLATHFEQIANVPVRNAGTIGGNLCYKNAHHEFPSDAFITLNTIDARLIVVTGNKSAVGIGTDVAEDRTAHTVSDFLTLDMRKRVLVAIELPRIVTQRRATADAAAVRTYKIAIRAQNAHAYVNGGCLVRFGADRLIASVRLCFGGIAPQFVSATATERLLVGRDLYTDETLRAALDSLAGELLVADWQLPDAQPEYRRGLAAALLYRFVLSTCPPDRQLSARNRSGSEAIERPLSSGAQDFGTVPANFPLTEPVNKYEGLLQASGEAKYIGDMPAMRGELWAAFAVANRVDGRVAQIDASAALRLPGVRFFYGAQDIPGRNNFTPKGVFTPEAEKIFAAVGDEIEYSAQPVGIVLADSFALANRAAGLVQVLYGGQTKNEEVTGPRENTVFAMARALLKPLLQSSAAEPARVLTPTIHDKYRDTAIPTTQFPSTTTGTAADPTANRTLSGRFQLAGQYHYHMETHTAIAAPAERGGLNVYASTQWVDFTQLAIAEMLGLPQNSIQMVVTRLGGAYGSKITRATLIACAAALGSHLAQRPVRFVMQLEANIRTIGKRCGLVSDYTAEVDAASGRIVRCTNTFKQDAGNSLNEAIIVESSLQTATNCYMSAGWTVHGDFERTDAPSNTFCRSPGTLEGIAMAENLMEHVAQVTGLRALDVRLANMAADSPLRAIIADFVKETEFEERSRQCEAFNAANRWKKRGLALVPMQWPLVYYGAIPAFVAIYHGDGTVVVAHGGVECGQGINTKVAQVVAYALGVRLDAVRVEPLDTVTSANAVMTGSSCTSEMVCYAAKKACDTLLERMRPVRDTLPSGYTWAALVAACYDKQIDLRATEQFKDTDRPAYSVYGVTAAEVEVDVLTGVQQLRRVDLWEDVGESMSPLVDVGQVEGAFAMGIGYWCTEQLVYDRIDGRLLTDRTWTYKPPGALDIPVDFRVKFLRRSPNASAGVLRSKAVGEPAICMSIVILCALRYAINSARRDGGLADAWLRLGSATTPEQIFLNCANTSEAYTL